MAFVVFFAFLCLCCFGGSVLADVPRGWEFGFQEPATKLMEAISGSYNFVTAVMSGIAAIVVLLLVYILIRFRSGAPGCDARVASGPSHNILLEIVWTLVPTIIVGIFTYYNVRLISYQNELPKDVALTVKAIGHQWYWEYYYPDYKGVHFDSYIKKDVGPEEHRLLEVDNRIVVPVGVNVRLQTSAADVIHSWAMPSFGIKIDAVPGRLNEAWFNVQKPGVYYGQCSELCGVLHGYMPIVVEAVPRDKFDFWIKKRAAEG